MKDIIERLRECGVDSGLYEAVEEAADLLERIYSQPVELPWPNIVVGDVGQAWGAESNRNLVGSDGYESFYTADQLTQAVQEATARALEAAAREPLVEALREIDNWLVCACIATPEDMAQSFPHMQQVAHAALAKAKGEKT